MLKIIMLLGFLLMGSQAWSLGIPAVSPFDSRIQHINYNSRNSTQVNARPGYLTTLLFDNDEQVIDFQIGFPQGWRVIKTLNRVDIIPAPITQSLPDAEGHSIDQVFMPTSAEWQTNLFIVTSKRYYSVELNVLDKQSPNQAFIIRYSYPDEQRQQKEEASRRYLKQQQEKEQQQQIITALDRSSVPRNWDYTKRVATGAEFIAPNFAYDDGRFVYLGFAPDKRIPSVFAVLNTQEQVVTPRVVKRDNYTLLVIKATSPGWVLRYGQAVVGIDNAQFGKNVLASDDTTSSAVVMEAK